MGAKGPAGGQLARLRPGRQRRRERTATPARSPASRLPSSAISSASGSAAAITPAKTCINLLVDGKVVRTATGHDSNQMRQDAFDVRELQGKTARLEIVDKANGPWGNIGVGPIVFTDQPARPSATNSPTSGTMALALLEPRRTTGATAAVDRRRYRRGGLRCRSAAGRAEQPAGSRSCIGGRSPGR